MKAADYQENNTKNPHPLIRLSASPIQWIRSGYSYEIVHEIKIKGSK